MIRVVLDTNIWLSGLLWGGIPRQIIQLCETGRIEIICSDEILEEFRLILNRPKFQKRFNQLIVSADVILAMAREMSTFVITEPVTVDNLRDPKDAIVVAAAIAGQCSVIVSGDEDLLILGTVFEIEIMTPRDFIDRYFPG
jgi:uncharacterized protein